MRPQEIVASLPFSCESKKRVFAIMKCCYRDKLSDICGLPGISVLNSMKFEIDVFEMNGRSD